MEWRKRLKPIDGLLVLGLVLVVVGLGIAIREKLPETKIEVVKGGYPPSPKASSGEAQGYSEVVIDIAGAVQRVGVYRLKNGSRINDALIVAGGLSAAADRDWVAVNINKAQVVTDGMKLYIPKLNEIISNSKFLISNEKIQINLNSATVEEFDKLPGVGPAMANKIVDYREKNGGFKNIEELKLVSGIGDKMFEEIKDKITL